MPDLREGGGLRGQREHVADVLDARLAQDQSSDRAFGARPRPATGEERLLSARRCRRRSGERTGAIAGEPRHRASLSSLASPLSQALALIVPFIATASLEPTRSSPAAG